jgi:hypothetical protein
MVLESAREWGTEGAGLGRQKPKKGRSLDGWITELSSKLKIAEEGMDN